VFLALFQLGFAHFLCCQKALSMLFKLTFYVVERDVLGLGTGLVILEEEGTIGLRLLLPCL